MRRWGHNPWSKFQMLFDLHGDKDLQFFADPIVPTIDKAVDVAEIVKFEMLGNDEFV